MTPAGIPGELVYERIPISLPEKAIIYDFLSKCYRKMGKEKEAYIFEKYAREFKRETDVAVLSRAGISIKV